jgi:hypothetical protein
VAVRLEAAEFTLLWTGLALGAKPMGHDYRPVAGPADHAKAQLLRRTHLGLTAVTSADAA